MKVLILYASPHLNGNTSLLLKEFEKYFKGECETIFLCPHLSNSPLQICIDCGGCKSQKGCIINDDFNKVIKDDYDVIVIASPIYMSNLPAQMFNVINRLNFTYYNRKYLGITNQFKPKIGVVLLTGGGEKCSLLYENSNVYLPLKQCKYIFKKLNASFDEENLVIAENTNEVSVNQNLTALKKVKDIAIKLNKKFDSNNNRK